MSFLVTPLQLTDTLNILLSTGQMSGLPVSPYFVLHKFVHLQQISSWHSALWGKTCDPCFRIIWGITKCLKVFVIQLLGYSSALDKLMVFICMAFIKPCLFLKTAIWVFSLFCFVSFLYSATMKPKVPPPLPPKVSEQDFVAHQKNAL